MQQARVSRIAGLLVPTHCPLEDFTGLLRGCPLAGGSGVEIPEPPWGAGHEGVGEQGADIDVIGVRAVGSAHPIGVGLGPRREIRRCTVRRVALGDCINQGYLDRARLPAQRQRSLGRRVRFLEHFR